ncbi:MAG TPA: hypothetical protein VGZ29_02165, partial [Terriglobia bacterium]|nr:hypothetical protein [Terriglobia bacterium]
MWGEQESIARTPLGPADASLWPARGNAHCTSTGGGGNTSLSFSSSTSRITNSGYSYDAAGHVACDGSYFYSWDADGRLASVATEGANCTAGTVL